MQHERFHQVLILVLVLALAGLAGGLLYVVGNKHTINFPLISKNP